MLTPSDLIWTLVVSDKADPTEPVPSMPGVERLSVRAAADAARRARDLGIPAIAGAGSLKGFELWQMDDAQMTADAFIAGGLSMVMALIAIALMMAWLRRATFTIFAVYRLLLGGFLLTVAYGLA